MAGGQPIFYSAVLLTFVNLLLRFVGTGFQVYLSGRIGAEGIGLLQLVMSVGSMALVAGTAGIRTATMYLTAEETGRGRPENNRWILGSCIRYSGACSAAISLVLMCFAPYLAASWVGNRQTGDAIRLFGAFLPVNCLTGVMVGYFTGVQRIRSLAAVEVAEQLCSMVCTVGLLTLWAGHDPAKCCLAVVMGSGIGSCLTLVCLTGMRLAEKQQNAPRIPVARRLLRTAVPLAIADDLRTGISTVENLMVPRRLALYPGVLSPLAAYGTVCGMVFPVLMFPVAILYGLTELLIPELARCSAAGSRARISHLVQKGLRVALLYGAMCAGVLFLTARELCEGLYDSQEAGMYLRWFAPLAVLLYCDTVTDAMIKGLGQQTYSVRYNIFTNILDVVFLFVLLPEFGILGYFLSFLLTHVLNFGLSLRRLLFITGEKLSAHGPLMTLLAAAAGVWAAGAVGDPWMRAGAYLVIYFCLLVLFQVLDREELAWIRGLIGRK